MCPFQGRLTLVGQQKFVFHSIVKGMPDNLTKLNLSTSKENRTTDDFRSLLLDTRTNRKGHGLRKVLETYG